MPRITTGKQAIEKIAHQPGTLEIATIINIDTLATDTNNAVLSASPIVTVNIHGIGGLTRVELSNSIIPKQLSVGDEIFVTFARGRYVGVASLPSSNRTAAGSSGLGINRATDFLSYDITLTGLIAGNQLELYWNNVPDADHYEIWASPTGSIANSDAYLVATSPSVAWVSKRDGKFFDDGLFYAVTARRLDGKSGTFSNWIHPTFVGNYAHGLLSGNQTSVIPGSLIVPLTGSIARADFTSVDSPTTFDVDVCDPIGSHPSAWANGDILQFTDTSGNKLWVTISSSTDQGTYWTYTVTKNDPGAATNYTILSGSTVADWGQAGQGIFIVSADGTFGSGTLWEIVTHAGAPWSVLTKQVYADSTGKILFGAGNSLDANGLKITVGAGITHAVSWYDGATLAGSLSVSTSPYHMILAAFNAGAKIEIISDVTLDSYATFGYGYAIQNIGSITLANGNNNNVDFGTPSATNGRVIGPTGAFAITGITNPVDGAVLFIANTTTQVMTIANQNAASTNVNRIITGTGADIVCNHAILMYDINTARWRVYSFV